MANIDNEVIQQLLFTNYHIEVFACVMLSVANALIIDNQMHPSVQQIQLLSAHVLAKTLPHDISSVLCLGHFKPSTCC